MKNKNHMWKKAEEGSMRSTVLVMVIAVVLLLSAGFAIGAQQTQGKKMATVLEQETVVASDCVYCTPQRPSDGGLRAEGDTMVCPLATGGIIEIQFLGQSWYNQLIGYDTQICTPYWNMSQPRGTEGRSGGAHGISMPISGPSDWNMGPSVLGPFPMTWAQLTERFAIVQAFDGGTGPKPYWWTDSENTTYMSAQNCNALSNCLIQHAGVDPYWAYVLMGFIVVDGNPYYYVPLVIAGAQNQQMAIQCLQNAGVI